MFRKITSTLIVITMLFTMIIIPSQSVVAKVSYASKQVAITMLIKEFSNLKFKKPTAAAFKDFKDWTKISSVNRTYVGKALANSIIPKSTNFYPANPVKRSEFASWTVKVLKKAAYNIKNIKAATKVPYKDVISVSDKANILYLYNKGLMKGLSSTSFGVKSYLTYDAMTVVKNNIKKALKAIPSATPTSKPSATPVPTPTPVSVPTNVPIDYNNLITNWEFETVSSVTLMKDANPAVTEDISYPTSFSISKSSRRSPKSDVGTYMKGMRLGEGTSTSNSVKIASTYAGSEFLITFDAKMNSLSSITDTKMNVRINARGTTGTPVIANDANTLTISDADFSSVTQAWKSFSKKVTLATLLEISGLSAPYFSADVTATGGEFQIDNLQVVPLVSGDESLGSFAFLKVNNPSLATNCYAKINQDTGEVTCKLPEGTNVTKLKATYGLTGGNLKINGIYLGNGATELNYTSQLTAYVLNNANVRQYKIAVSALKTGLPTVVIRTNSEQTVVSKDIFTIGIVSIVGGTTDYSIPMKESAMEIRGRGNSSWGMDKKSFKLKLTTSASVLGMPSNRDWVMIANYADKSLMRNYLAYTIAAGFKNLGFTPRMKFANVFYNGRYYGLYIIGDQIEIATNRVNVKKTLGTDTGFILEANVRMGQSWYNSSKPPIPYIWTKQATFMNVTTGIMNTNSNLYLEYVDPDPINMTNEQLNAIAAYINNVDNAINSKNSASYDQYIDYPSFNDWFLMEELFSNLDSGFFASCFMNKDVGGKLKMGPIWDFDSSAGNHTDSWFTKTNGWVYSGSYWLSNVVLNGVGLTRLKARWKEIKATNIDTIMTLIDQTTELIRPSFTDNFDLWKIQGTYVWPNSPAIAAAKTLDEQVKILKDWMSARINWMNSQLGK